MDRHHLQDASVILDLGVRDDVLGFDFNISTALLDAEAEMKNVEDMLSERLNTVKTLTSDCDKIDYSLAVTSGVICGVIDIFLIGEPGKSPIGDITDNWFENRTKDFAKFCGWDNKDGSSFIKFLENKFNIPYDQSVGGEIFKENIDLTPSNHHFKSLGHNPTLLGCFFSILDQFKNTSHFISNGEYIILKNSDGKFELKGNNIISKLFCGIANWLGHLLSDMSGSSSSKGRGMGIPSPLWSWTNDVIAIKSNLNIPMFEFDKTVNELALQIYKEGYDSRFQTAQVIPVFINEMMVRLLYSIRRMMKYYTNTNKEERSFALLWKSCEPFSNATVKRMLTVAHGTFCLVDIGDATIQGLIATGDGFNAAKFFMRLNVAGVGRFTISLYGEVSRGIKRVEAKEEADYQKREKIILDDYINGLKDLSVIYDDSTLITFVEDLKSSDMYKQAFEKTVLLAGKRGVSEDQILRTKTDIDAYFKGGDA